MLVYRVVSEREIANMLEISNFLSAPKGCNSFSYKYGVEYKHFFYFYDSAISFLENQNTERVYDKYSLIFVYDIDEKILQEHFGLGTYNIQYARKKDVIMNYFNKIYFPEFAIPKELLSKKMIVGIGNPKRITPISYIDYDEMLETINNNELYFLNYQKWLFANGTNVLEKTIFENKELLFPIPAQPTESLSDNLKLSKSK